MQIKYGKEQFNYLFQAGKYVMEKCDDKQVIESIKYLFVNLESVHTWVFEEGTARIVIEFDESMISTVFLIYESMNLLTYEGRVLMNQSSDKFTEFYRRDFKDGL